MSRHSLTSPSITVTHRNARAASSGRSKRTTSGSREPTVGQEIRHSDGSTRARTGGPTRYARRAPSASAAPSASRIAPSTTKSNPVRCASGAPSAAFGTRPRLIRPGSSSRVSRRRGRSQSSGGIGSSACGISSPAPSTRWTASAALPSSIGAEKVTDSRRRFSGTSVAVGWTATTAVVPARPGRGRRRRASSVQGPGPSTSA